MKDIPRGLGASRYLLCHDVPTAFFLHFGERQGPRDGGRDVVGDEGGDNGGSDREDE